VILDQTSDIAVVGEAADSHGAIDVVRRTRPDVVLMDLRMPGWPGSRRPGGPRGGRRAGGRGPRSNQLQLATVTGSIAEGLHGLRTCRFKPV